MAKQVIVDRYIARQGTLLIARGDFTPIFEEYLAHSREWVGDPDGLVATMMKQGLAAAGLYLTCRPRDENTAWTVNLPEPPLNLFFSADAATGKVVGRYFEDNIKAGPRTRFVVQLVRRTGKPHQSIIEVSGYDVLGYLEEYYAKSEQATARFYELTNTEFLMLMALPGTDESWLTKVSADDALRCLADDPDVKLIENRPIEFGCTCTLERLLQVVRSLFRDKPGDLFGDGTTAEASCPQCGKRYTINREEFEAEPLEDKPADD
jgi:Hsp33 protein